MLNNCCSALVLNDLPLSGVASAGTQCSRLGYGWLLIDGRKCQGGLIAPAPQAPQDSGFWGGAAGPNIRQRADVF